MSSDIDKSLNDHIAWYENISSRLESIYKELCDYEEAVNKQAEVEEPMKLFDLLESVNEIHAAAQNIHPTNKILKQKKKDLGDQMVSLQHAIDLLHLENKTKRVEVMHNTD